MKIVLLGYSGSGKSTLAKNLGEKLDIPVLYLDSVAFDANWEKKDTDKAQAIVRKFLDENESWIIDGNYSKLYQDERLEAADYIIFMQYGALTCYFRALGRYLENKGKVRESAADGCEEKFDLEFQKWILFETRTKKRRDKFKAIQKKYKEKCIVCRNDKQRDKLVYDRFKNLEK